MLIWTVEPYTVEDSSVFLSHWGPVNGQALRFRLVGLLLVASSGLHTHIYISKYQYNKI